jgi:hypothetical protein
VIMNYLYTRRLYRFEDALVTPFRGTGALVQRSMVNLREFAEAVWLLEVGDLRNLPVIVAGQGCSGTPRQSYQMGNRIELSRHERCYAVVLHELAHAMLPRGWTHGPAFVSKIVGLYVTYTNIDPERLHILCECFGLHRRLFVPTKGRR